MWRKSCNLADAPLYICYLFEFLNVVCAWRKTVLFCSIHNIYVRFGNIFAAMVKQTYFFFVLANLIRMLCIVSVYEMNFLCCNSNKSNKQKLTQKNNMVVHIDFIHFHRNKCNKKKRWNKNKLLMKQMKT